MIPTATRQTSLEYLFFFFGQSVSLLGSTIVQFVLIWWIVVEYGNPIYLSIAYLLGIGVQVLFMPIAGVYVDRWNRKLILGIADSFQALGAFALIFLFSVRDFFTATDLFWLVVWLLCFRGIMGSFHAPAAKAIVPLMVPRNHLDRLNSFQVLILGIINIVGPALGAVLYSLFPLNLIIWVDCITFILAVLPLIVITIPGIEKDLPSVSTRSNGFRSFFHEFRDGITILRSRDGLVALLLVITLINFLEIPIIVLGPFFVYTIHNGTVQDLAFVVAASQLGLLISGLVLLLKNGWSRKTFVIIIAFYIQIFGYFLQVITPIGLFWFMAIGAFVFGCMMPIINSLFRTIIHVVVPPELQGRVTAISAAITGAILPIGILASGPLAEVLGIQILFLIATILGFIILTVMWLFTDLRSLDKIQEIDVKSDVLPVESVPGVSN